ncbi:MAG TPA: hypothetical protein VMW79_08030 [Anaerolineae bacterium]|nr:hypothetical protein [Anaerolineae bacterium]
MPSVGNFFAELYGRCEDGYTMYGPIKGPFKASRTSSRWEELVQGQEDVYFRLCPLGAVPESGRGTQRESIALPFLWLDLDCGVHNNGKQYFPTIEEAIQWVKNYLPWTAIVTSGTGVHAYCVLSEPLSINDDASFERAYALSARFQQWARDMCKYDIDSTHDLARVLRVPGTIHSGIGKVVKIYELRTGEVANTEMMESLPVLKQHTLPTSQSTERGFVLDPNRPLDTGLLMQMSMNNPKFTETWMRQRQPADPSASGWRFSMISFLMNAGLDRQDVVDLTLRFLIDQCRYLPGELKLDRPDVWAAEMTKCKVEDLNMDELEELIETASIDDRIEAIAGLMEFPQPQRLKGLSRFLVMSSDDEASGDVFQLHIEVPNQGVVKVELKDIMSRTACRKTIFSKTGICLPYYSGGAAGAANKKWEQAVQVAWHAAEVYEPVQSESAELLMQAIKSQINTELAASVEESKSTGNPYKDGDTYVVPTAALNTRARTMYPELRSNRELHAAVRELRSVGIEKRPQMYNGVRMACLLVPAKLVEDAS